MTNRTIIVVAGACFVAGVALLYVGDGESVNGPLLRAAATALMILPAGLATNASARRRRHDLRHDDPSSLEYQAARSAGADAFRDSLVLGAGLILALAVHPGTTPALWGFAFLACVVVDYWGRYHLTRGRLGG